MKTHEQIPKFFSLPTDYLGLCNVAVPRPVHDQTGYENALEVLEAMAGFEHRFTRDQHDYFAVTADFVAQYEQSRTAEQDSTPRPPLEVLRYLLEENNLNATDLSRLLEADRTLGGKILRGERNLTVPHLRILATRFKVSPAVFV
jgi:antitoxin component HigA of HigAB toxin-antitoxin module